MDATRVIAAVATLTRRLRSRTLQSTSTRLLLAGLLSVLGFGACSPTDVGPSGSGAARASLLLRANLSGTTVATIVVEVTAPDFSDTLVFNIPNANGVASGTITVPTGANRHISLQAFDAGGIEADTGSVTVTVQPGTNPAVAVVLTPLAANVPINVTLGSYAVTLAPDAVSLLVGDTATLSATLLDAESAPVAGQVVWASLAPGIASIVSTGQQTGRITAVAPGRTTIVGAFGGTAGPSTILVLAPQDSEWVHEPPGLVGLATTAGDFNHDFVTTDIDGTFPTPSGWYNDYPADYADGQIALVSDPTAPFPNNVVQITYPIGWNIGAAPGQVSKQHAFVTEYYLAFYFKVSQPYQSDYSGHNKIAYIYAPSAGMVFEFHPYGNDWLLFMADYISDPNHAEQDHYGSTTVSGGVWYKVEILMSYSNSRVRWWVNGALDQDFACDFASNAGGGLYRLQFSPTYGGGGSPTKTEVDHVWYDHVHLSGMP